MTRARTLLAGLLTSAVLLASPAVAGITGDYFYNAVNIRTGPATSYTSLGLGYPGDGICSYFSAQGEAVNPGNSIWYYHVNGRTSVTGYSYGDYIYFDYPVINCD